MKTASWALGILTGLALAYGWAIWQEHGVRQLSYMVERPRGVSAQSNAQWLWCNPPELAVRPDLCSAMCCQKAH